MPKIILPAELDWPIAEIARHPQGMGVEALLVAAPGITRRTLQLQAALPGRAECGGQSPGVAGRGC